MAKGAHGRAEICHLQQRVADAVEPEQPTGELGEHLDLCPKAEQLHGRTPVVACGHAQLGSGLGAVGAIGTTRASGHEGSPRNGASLPPRTNRTAAGAGGAAHLPGMLAAYTHLPVLGVPIETTSLNGMDSLLSIAQMPAGVPVGTLAIGSAGAKNAALLAVQILALSNDKILQRLNKWRQEQTDNVILAPE